MRFLVDENLPAGIAGELVSRGFEVLDLAVSEARGASELHLARGREIERLFADAMSRIEPSVLLGAVTGIEPGRVRQRRYSDLEW